MRAPAFSTDRENVALMQVMRRPTRGAPDFGDLIENDLLMIDGPRHRPLRDLVAKAFTPPRRTSRGWLPHVGTQPTHRYAN